MIWLHRIVVVVALAIIASPAAAEQVQEIPGNWESPGMRRISVVNATASSALTPEGGQYAAGPGGRRPARHEMGGQHRPSQAAPQWITLELFGTQEVSAVAVFGERIDNDGIQDAQVQVAGPKPGEFTTVATIAGRQVGQLAGHVRSGEDHGRATADHAIRRAVAAYRRLRDRGLRPRRCRAAELKGYAAERLERCARRDGRRSPRVAEKLGLKTDSQFAGLRGAVGRRPSSGSGWPSGCRNGNRSAKPTGRRWWPRSSGWRCGRSG